MIGRDSASPAGQTLLRFRIGDCDLSLDVAIVEMVIRLGGWVADMKRRMPGVQGAIPLHGKVVPVIDLGRALDMPAGESTRGILAHLGDVRVTFGVEEVVGLYDRPEEPVAVPESLGALRGVVREFHSVEGRIVGWLDPEKILSDHDWEGIRSLSEVETEGLLGDETLRILGY